MAGSVSLARSSLVSEVQESIKELILERQLTPGDPLPTEHELSETLGISRNSLREALKVLEATGVVVIRRGFGMFVGEMNLQALISELVFHARLSAITGTKELRDLIDLREVLERSLVQRVIPTLQEADVRRIDEAVQSMEKAAAAGEFSPETDRIFHEQLYAPLDNAFVSQLLSAFWTVFNELQEHLPASAEPPEGIAANHRAIFDAMVAGDIAGAQDAMSRHFDGIKLRLNTLAESLEGEAVPARAGS